MTPTEYLGLALSALLLFVAFVVSGGAGSPCRWRDR